MLDVHTPHNPTHTWRDFLLHIATIVLGLLIAIALEQTVEYFHHRHQAHRLEETLIEESNRNSKTVQADIVVIKQVIATEERNKASLERAMAANGRQPFTYEIFDPAPGWSPTTNAVYAAARDNGTLGLLSPSLASYLARLEFNKDTISETSHQVFDDHYKVLAFAKLRPDPNQLTPAEQEQFLIAISNYQQVAEHSLMALNKSLRILRMEKQTPNEAVPER